VPFIGYLYVMDLNNARKLEHTSIKKKRRFRAVRCSHLV